MKKSITVTENNIAAFYPYQGVIKPVAIGMELEIISTKIPYPQKNGTFAIVTDWQPSDNSQRMINRANDVEAEKYGWKAGAEITAQCIKEKKEAIYFNRYSIDMTFIK